jgi:hypothetical protein
MTRYVCQNEQDRENCYGCHWLELDKDSELKGTCMCPFALIYNRQRDITDKACNWKCMGLIQF